MLFNDVPLADDLYHRTSPQLPGAVEGQLLVGFNERWRFYRYDPQRPDAHHIRR